MLHTLPVAMLMTACSSSTPSGVGPYAPTKESRALELAAVNNLQCAWENQNRCAHLIEKRTVFAQFFAPRTVGKLSDQKKNEGRRVTTKFIVEASAGINQCNRVNAQSIVIVKDIRIAEKGYRVEGTAPLSANSTCFLNPDPENP